MEWLLDLARLVAAITIVGGGMLAIGKTKFITKKEYEKRRDMCQRKVFDSIKELHDDIKGMNKNRNSDMTEIKEFMGKVNYHIERANGR